MTGPQLISGSLRDYDWGVVDGLSAWCRATGGPEAELWFGAHPGAPSPTADGSGTLLDVWGDGSVPLLAKLLAAGSPLSLQVHPDADTAVRWWSDGEARALLADQSEKTEMLVALDPFLVLAGWRPAEQARTLLAAVGASEPVLAALVLADHAAAVRLLLGDHPVSAAADAWDAALTEAGGSDIDRRAMAAVVARFGADPGVAVAALLAADLLQPGDAVYVPAGVPHAYVTGLGFEIMNSSDNVLRMGLTAKPMSVGHTLAALRPDRTAAIIRRPVDGDYAPAGAPFAVHAQRGGQRKEPTGVYRLVVCLAGTATVTADDVTVHATPGQAVALAAGSTDALITADDAVIVRATGGRS